MRKITKIKGKEVKERERGMIVRKEQKKKGKEGERFLAIGPIQNE